jgi:hypothetical protein
LDLTYFRPHSTIFLTELRQPEIVSPVLLLPIVAKETDPAKNNFKVFDACSEGRMLAVLPQSGHRLVPFWITYDVKKNLEKARRQLTGGLVESLEGSEHKSNRNRSKSTIPIINIKFVIVVLYHILPDVLTIHIHMYSCFFLTSDDMSSWSNNWAASPCQ